MVKKVRAEPWVAIWSKTATGVEIKEQEKQTWEVGQENKVETKSKEPRQKAKYKSESTARPKTSELGQVLWIKQSFRQEALQDEQVVHSIRVILYAT